MMQNRKIEAFSHKALERYFELHLYAVVLIALVSSYFFSIPGLVFDEVYVLAITVFLFGIFRYRILPTESKRFIRFTFEQKSLVIAIIDILSITYLVSISGGPLSPFFILYVFPILVGALFLPPAFLAVEMFVMVVASYFLFEFSARDSGVVLAIRVLYAMLGYSLAIVISRQRMTRESQLKESEAEIEFSNQELKKNLNLVAEKNEYLESVKRATLNILEDLENEKASAIAAALEARKFQQAAEASTDGLTILSPNGFVRYANPAWFSLMDCTPEQAINQDVRKFFAPDTSKDILKKFEDTLANGTSLITEDIPHVRPGGLRFETRLSVYPVKDQGKVIFFVKSVQDITARKELDRQKTEFISVASHQLRTPLSAMNWFLEMLASGEVGPVNDKQKEYLDQVFESNHRLITLVNDLLNVSRLETGRFAFKYSSVNLHTLIQGIVREMEHYAQAGNVKLENLLSASDFIITSDGAKITEVLRNIISNAIKYTKGKGTVTIATENIDGKIKISIKDQGVGIPKSQHAYVYDKFFRADNVVRLQTEGTGLGLYIAKLIVEGLGGVIDFESHENVGTTFWVILPKTAPLQEAKDKQASSSPSGEK